MNARTQTHCESTSEDSRTQLRTREHSRTLRSETSEHSRTQESAFSEHRICVQSAAKRLTIRSCSIDRRLASCLQLRLLRLLLLQLLRLMLDVGVRPGHLQTFLPGEPQSLAALFDLLVQLAVEDGERVAIPEPQ